MSVRLQGASAQFPSPMPQYNRENEAQFRAAVRAAVAEMYNLVVPGPFFDVRQPPYSAKGDGVANDTVAIQQAIDDADDLGGGTVYVPEGVYMISQLRMKSKVELRGSGWGSVLKQIASSHTTEDSGTSSGSNTTTTLNDTTQDWTDNQWSEQLGEPYGWCVYITGGTGSGQTRYIVHNTGTPTTLSLDPNDPWDTTPDATSTYAILAPKHMIVPDSATVTEQVSIRHLTVDGNKANQFALNRGIDLSQKNNEVHEWESGDPHHVADHLKIRDTKGSAFKTGYQNRECDFRKIWAKDAGMYGFELRGTDNMYLFLTADGARLHGFYQADPGCRILGSKAFGCSGHGFYITQPQQEIIECIAQDDGLDGFHLSGADYNRVTGTADRNGFDHSGNPSGVHIDNSDYNFICVSSINTTNVGTGAHDQDYAVTFANAPQHNVVIIMDDGNNNVDLVGGSDQTSENTVITRELYNFAQARMDMTMGTAGSTDDTHWIAGKRGAGTASNPSFEFRTGTSSPPTGGFHATDGTDGRTFMVFNFGTQHLELGTPGTTDADDRVYPFFPAFNDTTRPSAGTRGRVIYNQDDENLNIDNGTNWILPDGTTT